MHDIDTPMPEISVSVRAPIQQHLSTKCSLASCLACQRIKLQQHERLELHGAIVMLCHVIRVPLHTAKLRYSGDLL